MVTTCRDNISCLPRSPVYTFYMRLNINSTRLRGVVTRYKGNGRKLGYPTANFKSSTTIIDGVYFGFATMAEYADHPALIFIGTPTTIGDKDRRVEAHLLDIVDRDYYNLDLILDVQKPHRANKTFDSVEQLVDAIKSDELAARKWFSSNKLASENSLADTK